MQVRDAGQPVHFVEVHFRVCVCVFKYITPFTWEQVVSTYNKKHATSCRNLTMHADATSAAPPVQ